MTNKFPCNKIIGLLIFVLGSFSQTFAQNAPITGEVSYVTSQNVYVKFASTDEISVGDTLSFELNGKLQPALVVLQKSSLSIVGQPISDIDLQKGFQLSFRPKSKSKKPQIDGNTVSATELNQSNPTKPKIDEPEPKKAKFIKESIDGRVSVANYTTTGLGNTSNRFMSRLSLRAKNIGGGNFSFNTYLNYRNANAGTTNGSKFNRVNVFQMNLSYEVDSSFTLSLGRKINNRMYSVGAIDGLHAEKRYNSIFVGGVAGFRPNPLNFGLNTNLFEYGGYIGMFHDKYRSTNTTVGFVDQRYGNATDRRYLFAQHSSNLTQNLLLFAMAEADLYQKDTLGNTSSNLSPTNLFVSLQYRLTSKWRFMVSFDQRKNTILYESYATSLEQLSKVNPIRTGVRLRVNYQLSKKFAVGVFTNNRVQSDQKSDFFNVGGMLSLTSLGKSKASIINTFTYNQTNFFNYLSNSLRYRQPLFKNKVSVSPFFRFLHYSYSQHNVPAFNQFYSGIDAITYLKYNISFGFMYEYSIRQSNAFNRFNFQLIKRF